MKTVYSALLASILMSAPIALACDADGVQATNDGNTPLTSAEPSPDIANKYADLLQTASANTQQQQPTAHN